MDASDLDSLRTKEYWNSRYDEEPLEYEFDWFKSFDDLSRLFKELLRPDDHILMLGCGNSVLGYSLGLAELFIDPFSASLRKWLSKNSER